MSDWIKKEYVKSIINCKINVIYQVMYVKCTKIIPSTESTIHLDIELWNNVDAWFNTKKNFSMYCLEKELVSD